MAKKTITISSKTYNAVLDEILRLEMWDFKEVQNRRISVMPGIDDGIIQDYGVHSKDKVFTGSLWATINQATTLKNIKEHSTISIWNFGVDNNLYEVYIIKLDGMEQEGDKVIIDIEFRVNSKII